MYWALVDHPQQLNTILGLIQRYNIKPNEINLLISYHPYHKKINDEYKKNFNSIYIFERVNLGKNIIRDIYRLFIQNKKVNELKKQVQSDDVFLLFSAAQVLENFIVSKFKSNKKIGIFPEVQYRYAYKELNDFVQYPRMKIYSPLMKVFGLEKVFNGLLKGYTKKTKDGIDALRFIQPIHEIYDYIFYMVNINNTTNDYLESYKNSYKINYLSYKEKCETSMKKQVIFFGNCFLSFNNFPSERFAKNTDKFLNYLRKYYKDSELIYIPHPREDKEMKIINLDGFHVYKGGLNAELYFQKNYCNIEACFSIASTVTRNALAYDIQSYSFLKVMGFEKQQEEYYTNLYGNIQDEVYIESLEEMTQRIEFQSINSEKLQEVLGL